jgi:hypothetical protein
MLALAYVVHFLAHEFAGLGAWRLSFSLVLLSTLQGLLVGHGRLRHE